MTHSIDLPHRQRGTLVVAVVHVILALSLSLRLYIIRIVNFDKLFFCQNLIIRIRITLILTAECRGMFGEFKSWWLSNFITLKPNNLHCVVRKSDLTSNRCLNTGLSFTYLEDVQALTRESWGSTYNQHVILYDQVLSAFERILAKNRNSIERWGR